MTRYAAFYLATSLGWDLPRGVLTAVLVMVAGRPVLSSLRRGTRRAAFGATGEFVEGHRSDPPRGISEVIAPKLAKRSAGSAGAP